MKTLANGLTRYQMINQIHLECDTSSACYRMNDEQLIETYNEIFGIKADVQPQYSDYGFIDVTGMTYDEVRNLGRGD